MCSEDWMEGHWNSLHRSCMPRRLAFGEIWSHADCLNGLRDFTDDQHEEIAEVSHAFSNVATVSVEALDRFAAQTLLCLSTLVSFLAGEQDSVRSLTNLGSMVHVLQYTPALLRFMIMSAFSSFPTAPPHIPHTPLHPSFHIFPSYCIGFGVGIHGRHGGWRSCSSYASSF